MRATNRDHLADRSLQLRTRIRSDADRADRKPRDCADTADRGDEDKFLPHRDADVGWNFTRHSGPLKLTPKRVQPRALTWRMQFSDRDVRLCARVPDVTRTSHVGDDLAQSSDDVIRIKHAGELRGRFDAVLQRHHDSSWPEQRRDRSRGFDYLPRSTATRIASARPSSSGRSDERIGTSKSPLMLSIRSGLARSASKCSRARGTRPRCRLAQAARRSSCPPHQLRRRRSASRPTRRASESLLLRRGFASCLSTAGRCDRRRGE